MVDNSTLNVSSGTEVFANDDIGGVKYPRAKMTWGPDGTANDTDVASGKPLPTQLRHSDGTIVTDATGVKISTSQLAALLSAYVPIATTNATQVALPTDHPTLAVSQDTSRVLNGASGTSLTPKWAVISASSSGDNTVVSAVTSKKIRVLFWDLSPNAAVNAKWKSSTTTDKTGLYYMGGQGNGNSRPFNPVGWFETASGEALTLNLSGAVAVGGVVGYVEV